MVKGEICRQTDSIGSDGDRLPWQEAIGLAACQLTIVLGNIKQGRVEEEAENVGKRTPSDVMETGCHGKRPSDSLRVSSRETQKYTARYSLVKGVENIGKRTPSDPRETDCRSKRLSDSPHVSSRETQKVHMQQSRVQEGVENVGKRTLSDLEHRF